MNRNGYIAIGALVFVIGALFYASKVSSASDSKAKEPTVIKGDRSVVMPDANQLPKAKGPSKYVSDHDMRTIKTMLDDREEALRAVKVKLRAFEKSDKDAKRATALNDEIEKWVETVAGANGLNPKCFILGLNEQGRKKCGADLWGLDERGEIQTAK